jgi:hypothetical protein
MPYKNIEDTREARRRSYAKLKDDPASWVTRVREDAKKKRTRRSYATEAERLAGAKENHARAYKKRGAANLAFYRDVKACRSCENCGYSNPLALDFHHIDPATKEGNLAKSSYKWSRKRLLQEIAKCQVLCANCHRIEHHRLRLAKKQEVALES